MSRAGTSSAPAPRQVATFLLRLVGAYLLLTVALVLLERPVARATAPLARAGLALFARDLAVRSVAVDESGLVAQVATVRARPDGGRGAQRVQLTVRTNPRTLLVAPILALALVAAWAFRTRRERAIALAAAAALVLVALAHDLASGVAAGVAEALGQPAGLARFTRFVLENGGRQALALAIAAGAAWLATRAGDTSREDPPMC